MSSLAGALGQPTQSGSTYLAIKPEDVEMDSDSVVSLKVEEGEPYVGPGRQGVDDLFGNEEDMRPDGDIKSESAPTATPAGSGYDSDSLSQAEREHRRALEYAEPDEPSGLGGQIQEANVSIPNIPIPQSSDGQYWVIRMPSFVKVDSKPFHPDTYVGPEQDEEEANQNENVREKSMTIKLKVENTVRWRWVKDEFGQDKRQSNSRIIRWSDGSLSLRLGKELFHTSQTVETSGGLLHSSQGESQASMSQSTLSASQQPLPGSKPQGLTYLVAQHKRSEVLHAEAAITGYMTLRPTGMQSETHRMLVRAVGQKHNKIARLRMAPDPTMDPEREKLELMKLSAKKSRKRIDDGTSGVRKRRSSYSRKRTGTGVWSDDEEPEFEGSDVEDDMGSHPTKHSAGQEKRKGPGEYQEDDFVVPDESDEEAGFGEDGSGKKKRRHHDEDEEDPLDRLDAKISQMEDERKRKSQVSGDVAEDDDQDMEVESEEDEEEQRVRKAGLGARKKRAMAFDEEEE